MRNKSLFLFSLLIMASMILGACATPTPETIIQTQEVIKTVEVVIEGETVIVTATPEPVVEKEFTSADASTLVYTTFGEPDTLDPALDYETAGGNILANVYESLVFYNRERADEFVAALAEEVPSAENGLISEDGKTYTFNIREGVTFHNGAELTPSDVAFSYVRGVLQGSTSSPQWLFTEAYFGVGVDDISVLVEAATQFGVEALPTLTSEQIGELPGALYDDIDGMVATDPAILAGVCEYAKTKVVADDAAGTLTLNLQQAWAPLISTLAGYWGAVMDQDWVAENGGWDGDCATWQNFYAITAENSPFTAIANGTGPYMLDHWTQGQEIGLLRFDDYWRTEPIWEGGPSGPASIERILIKKVDEWGTRFAMAQAGDSDFFTVNRENVAQVDPLVGEWCYYDAATDTHGACEVTGDGPFRLYIGAPTVTRTDVFLNFNINNPEGGNTFIGSGQLDGNGIPVDFFSDIHIRKAFNYCFDWETFINDALVGEGIQSIGIPLPGMPGFDANGPIYSYDPDKCAEEFQLAELSGPNGETVWDTGFRLQIAYNTGNTTRQTVAEILGETLITINDKFQVEVIGLPWPTFLRSQNARTLPMFISGWHEDIHDPHNWYVPYLTGLYGRRQSLPEEFLASAQAQINAGVAETDPAARNEIYTALNQEIFDLAPQIILAVATQRHYEHRWIDGWYYNPAYSDAFYYAYSKK